MTPAEEKKSQNHWLRVAGRVESLCQQSFVTIAVFLLVAQAQAVFIKLGPFSLSVYATILASVLVTLGLGVSGIHTFRTSDAERRGTRRGLLPRLFRLTWPLLALLLYSSVWLTLDWRLEGAQNLLAQVILAVGLIFLALQSEEGSAESLLRFILYVSLVMSAFFVVFSFVGLPGFANRQFAMIMMPALAIGSVWPPTSWLIKASPFVITFAILLSQSRTAAVIAIMILALHIVRLVGGRSRVLVGFILATAATAMLAFLAIVVPDWLRDRAGIDLGVEERDLTGTNGRFQAWSEFLGLLNTPADWLFGRGTGAAMEYGTAYIPYFSHPHNEYLRYLVDYGIFGLALLLLGAIFLLWTLTRVWRVQDPVVNSAAVLLVALGLMASTDGALYSSFVIIPSTIVLGLGVGRALHLKSLEAPAPTKPRASQ